MGDHTGALFDQAEVEVGKVQKCLDVFDEGGGVPGQDGIDFLWVHGDSIGGRDVAEEVGGVDVELALFWFSGYLGISEFVENGMDMLGVFDRVVAVYWDIVEVAHAKDVEVFTEDVVHDALEGGRGVG